MYIVIYFPERMNPLWMTLTLTKFSLSWRRARLVLFSLLWTGIFAYDSYQDQCEIIPGTMSLPALEKKGDIILGGLFSLHDMVVEPSLSFTSTPPSTQCTR